MLFADDVLLLGPDLLAWLVLAIGGAMAVGSAAALIRPPQQRPEAAAPPPSRTRSIVFIVVGTLAAIWALATLTST